MKELRGNLGRGVSLAAVIAASVAAYALFGGVGHAQSVGLAQSQYGEKMTICHKGKNTIRISTRAWPAHKRHGDTLGTCAAAKKKAKAKADAKKAAGKKGKSGDEHGKNGDTSAPTAGKGKGNGNGNDQGGKHQS